MKQSTSSPDDHLATLNEKVRSDIEALDKLISSIMEGESRVLWTGKFWGGSDQEIIGYGDMNYENTQGTVEWFKIGLAVQKNYISLYVNAVDGKKYVVEKYAKQLGKVKTGKSSVSFATLDDVDMDSLRAMLTEARDKLAD